MMDLFIITFVPNLHTTAERRPTGERMYGNKFRNTQFIFYDPPSMRLCVSACRQVNADSVERQRNAVQPRSDVRAPIVSIPNEESQTLSHLYDVIEELPSGIPQRPAEPPYLSLFYHPGGNIIIIILLNGFII